MIWVGISWRGKTPSVFVEGNMNAIAYVDMFVSVVDPFIEENYPKGLVFQQNNAAAHTAKHARDYFMEEVHKL